MPWTTKSGRPLESHIDEEAAGRCVRRIADAATDAMHRNTVERTPVSPPRPPGSDRLPGTLKKSIQRTPVQPAAAPRGRGWKGTVFTDDPVGPHVEHDTDPHDIPNAFGFGEDFGIGGRFGGKFHPGTTGQHMFALGAAETDRDIEKIAKPAIERFRREVIR